MVFEEIFHYTPHHVMNSVAVEAACTGSLVKCFAVTTVQGEGGTEFFTVITAELRAVSTPPPVTFIDSHFTGMCST